MFRDSIEERDPFLNPSKRDFLEKESLRTNMKIIEENASQERIRMEDFIEDYGEEEIEWDKKSARKLKERYEQKQLKLPEEERENHRIAKMLEKVIEEVAELNEWFGGEAVVIKTCDYDDYKNGVDLVLEFNGEKKRSFLAVDVCMAFDYERVAGKVERNLNKVKDEDAPLEVKYYCSEIEGSDGKVYKGKIKKAVPVVIGIDRNNAEELFNDCAELLQTKNKEAKTRVHTSKAQVIFLEQIKNQLELYKESLEDKRMLRKVEDLLYIIANVREEKKEEGIVNDGVDKMEENIERACKRHLSI